MAKTGPQKHPGASLEYWHQDAWPGSAMESNVGVLHTTEGRTVPDYRGGRDAPNFTLLPDIQARKLRVFQHFDFDVSSRALVNLNGGVETNTANAVQFELVGTCDERHAETWDGKRAGVDYTFWPDAPDWLLAELGRIVRWAHDQHGIKMQSTVTWKAYKKGQDGGSYGDNGVRLTGAQWGAYYGWLGHQHVPENAHGDPGDIDFARVLAHATGTTAEKPMTLSQEDLKQITNVTLGYNGSLPNGKPDPTDVYGYVRTTSRDVASLKPKLGAIAERMDQLQTTGLTDAQIEAIAVRTANIVAPIVADLLAARLAK